jgi:hypothetical protein
MPPDPAPRLDRSLTAGPFHSCLSLESEGLVLGNGTVLASTRYDPFGRRQSTEDRIEFRLLALLRSPTARRYRPMCSAMFARLGPAGTRAKHAGR